jgi:glyoxylase-like metal-dependent hydrolase (beta-lactamase superfamily II)
VLVPGLLSQQFNSITINNMIKSKLFMMLALTWISIAAYAAGPVVHVYRSGPSGIYSNAYIVELQNGVVVVDATLSVSSARDVRGLIDEIGKPVYAILITHGHPDHYNGLTEITNGLKVPIYATQGVLDVITHYDAEKEKQWKPVFGDEWPAKRTFPNTVIKNEATLTFENTSFTVHDLGAGESHRDSYWIMQTGRDRQVFVGDVVLHKVHAYMSDDHITEWLNNIRTLKTDLKDVSILYPGHGLAGGIGLLDWQKNYIDTYLSNLKPLWSDKQITEEEKKTLTVNMKKFLPNDKLEFLIGLGAEPVAKAAFK